VNSAISVSTISWRADPGGNTRFPKEAPPGYISANVGAADGELSLFSATDELRRLTDAELARAGQAPGVVAPKTLVPSGETRDIHRAGGS
jgi:hypothetical protein